MLVVDGYKMASGVATIQFRDGPPFGVDSVWLYRPDKDLWTCAPCPTYPWGGTFNREEVLEIREEQG